MKNSKVRSGQELLLIRGRLDKGLDPRLWRKVDRNGRLCSAKDKEINEVLKVLVL